MSYTEKKYGHCSDNAIANWRLFAETAIWAQLLGQNALAATLIVVAAI